MQFNNLIQSKEVIINCISIYSSILSLKFKVLNTVFLTLVTEKIMFIQKQQFYKTFRLDLYVSLYLFVIRMV